MPLNPGDVIDRYRVLGLLGAGGMGEVYQAVDTRLQRLVALKILHPKHDEYGAESASQGAAFLLREARAAAALEHPNIVGVYDVGTVAEPESLRGTTYLAMELIKGRSLRAYVGDASVPIAQRVRWLVEVARALGAAHAMGLVHRDIKPENVMVRQDGVVKVLDFGIAKRAHTPVDPTSSTESLFPSVTTAGLVVGTPFYMAPEQMRGETLDGRGDQFSWGVMAYELLVGKAPWSLGRDAITLVAEVLSREVDAVDARNPEVPRHVAKVVARALEKKRDARFATMEELVAAIESLELGSARTEPKIPTSGPSLPPVRSSIPEVVERPVSTTAKTAAAKPNAWMKWALGGGIVAAAAGGIVYAASRSTPVPLAVTNSATTSSAPVATRGCSSNAQCVRENGGKPFICHKDDGTCAPLESEDCKVYAEKGDVENDETVWLGLMVPRAASISADGPCAFQSAELARREFAEAMRPYVAQHAVRPIALIGCDDGKDYARAARHLVNQARSPAVIGFQTGTEAIDVTASYLVPSLTLAMVFNTTSVITSLPQPEGQPRLIWRVTNAARLVAAPMAALVANVFEPELRAAGGGLSRGDAMHVALVQTKSAGAPSFTEAVFKEVRFNGKSAIENGRAFREYVCDQEKPESCSGVREDLAGFLPDVILFSGGDSLFENVFRSLEERWPAAKKNRPRYVKLSGYQEKVLRFIGTDVGRRHRFFGIDSVATSEENAQYVARYNSAFSANMTRAMSCNESYDAFYILAYATYALGKDPVAGPSLARSIPRLLPPGKPIGVGPSQMFEAYDTLRSGKNIDLTGAGGKLDFDPATGEAPFDFSVRCIQADDHGRAAFNAESGLVYDGTTRALRGKLDCP